MNDARPAVSVIIPTRNRSASLRRTLNALRSQTVPPDQMEVIVVADACEDDTLETLGDFRAGWRLIVLQQPGVGAAVARNCGASHASAPFLLFLDDDVEPTPGLVDAHLQTHGARSGCVGIGPYPPLPDTHPDLFRITLKKWWDDLFRTMRRRGHRYTFRDLVAGNLSLESELFRRSGGFDPAFRGAGGEDWEFGVRLLELGAGFVFVPDALAHHHEQSDFQRSLQRTRQEGRADVVIGRRHPQLRPLLPLARVVSPRQHLKRALRSLAFDRPSLGDHVAEGLRRLAGVAERAGLRRAWRGLNGSLRHYWYWRGVAEEVGSRRALSGLLQAGPARADEGREITLDLGEGLEEVERRLDAERPDGVRLMYGHYPVGRIPPLAGAERLRGEHLRPFLATHLSVQFLVAMAMDRATGGPARADDQAADFFTGRFYGGARAGQSA